MMERLKENIRAIRRNIDAASANDPDYLELLDRQGTLYRNLFNHTGDLDDLQEAIEAIVKSTNMTPEGDRMRPKRFAFLGSLFRDKFLMTDDPVLADIEAAISYAKAAADVTQDSHNRRTFLNDVGIYYHEKFLVTDESTDIDEAINFIRQVVNTYSEQEQIPARVSNSLGTVLGARFLKSGGDAVIDEALEHTKNAVDITSDDDPDKAKFLGDLATLYGDRFPHSGNPLDLDLAIENYQKVMALTSDDDPSYAGRLNNLASLLRDRYLRDNGKEDLEQALKFAQQAVDLTAQPQPERATYLSNLANILGERYLRGSQTRDIENAIIHAREAIRMTPDDHADRSRRLNTLGVLLRQKSLKTPTQAAKSPILEEAIQVTLAAVKATEERDWDYAGRINNLGLLFGDAYRCTGLPADLDKAIHYSREAIRLTSDNAVDRATYQSNLGSLFEDRYELNGRKKEEDLQNAISSYESCLGTSSGLPLTRILAGQSAVYHLVAEKKWERAAELLDQVLNILPEVTQPSSARDDLQYTLRQFFGLASLTGSVFLKAGRTPVQAFQALEQSRGVISSLMMDFRADLSSLKEKDNDKRSQYLKIRQQITAANAFRNSALLDISAKDYISHDLQRERLFKTLSDIQNEIRACEGCENFLLPPSENEILNLARAGPLVSFNVSDVSSEAFLITTDGIRVLCLPDLKKEKLRRCIDTCASRGNLARRDASLSLGGREQKTLIPEMSTELSALWNVAVKPVLSELGLVNPVSAGEKLPHVWWVGGGIMAQVPIHAAGDHSRGSTENTLSHVVSSYVTTLKMLQFTRNKPQTLSREGKPKVLVVSMPSTPGHKVWLDVAEEVAAIKKHVGSWASMKVLERPTKEEVLSEFETCTIAHFACHGIADTVEPAKSALLLGREKQERLALGDLDPVSRDDTEIAYLSACSTAELKVEDLVDESIHLASAFQLIGFRHVIGTLWGADDAAAVAIAGKFYEELLKDSKSEKLPVSHALHCAVMDFRAGQDNCAAIWKWAPFIHLGG
jgi:tetratricopeptide (TPR) repeat protein